MSARDFKPKKWLWKPARLWISKASTDGNPGKKVSWSGVKFQMREGIALSHLKIQNKKRIPIPFLFLSYFFIPFFHFIFPFLSLCILTNDTPGTVDTFCLSTPRGHSISDNRSGRIIWPARWRSLMSSMRRVLKAYLYPIFFAQSALNPSIH